MNHPGSGWMDPELRAWMDLLDSPGVLSPHSTGLSSGFLHPQTDVPHCGVKVPCKVGGLAPLLRNPSGSA